jgi:hypothetical protein
VGVADVAEFQKKDRDSAESVNQSVAAISEALLASISRGHFRGFVGLYPNVNTTGDPSPTKGARMSKMGSARYRRYLYLAADNAYKWDVELAAFYHKRRRGGHTHTQAVCAVANAKLLPRIHHLLKELKQAKPNQVRPQYVFRDLSGNPISKAEAKAIIMATWGGVKY